ncbi:hypothetical protein MRB53_022119 [Persea americana]|uniref:Uncharacterized protein n=1 Tax=Persea americana TaxID=3435 RepID=A0ACC2L5M3_PERAE|nr:hypothetical protein MRB53_022119 [Persea americana]
MASGQTTSAGSRVQAKFNDSGDVEEGAGLLLSFVDEDGAGGPRGCCSLLTGRAMVLLLCDEARGHKGARDGTCAAMDALAMEV